MLGQYKKCGLWVMLTYSTYSYFEFNEIKSKHELSRTLVHVRNSGHMYHYTFVVPNCCDNSNHAHFIHLFEQVQSTMLIKSKG